MFRSTTQFEGAVLKFLNSVNTTSDQNQWQGSLDDIEYHDVIEHAISHDYITGLSPKLGADGMLSLSLNSPRLTFNGLRYLESNHLE